MEKGIRRLRCKRSKITRWRKATKSKRKGQIERRSRSRSRSRKRRWRRSSSKIPRRKRKKILRMRNVEKGAEVKAGRRREGGNGA
jgi:hypothetical protein